MKISHKTYTVEEDLAAREIDLWEINIQLQMPKWYMVEREEIELKAEKVRILNSIRRLRKELAHELELQRGCELEND
jgi:hypothetical protein